MKSYRFQNWRKIREDVGERISNVFDENGYILFFKNSGNIFAAREDSRVVFATMKNPSDEDLPISWDEEANFTADNMHKAMRGELSEEVFYKDDMDGIEIIDREEALAALKESAKKLGDKAFSNNVRFQIIKMLQPEG